MATAWALLAIAAPTAHAAPFVYVTGGYRSDDSVFQFDAGPSGLLAPLSPPAVTADQRPTGVAVSPDGKSLYVTNAGAFEDGDPGYRDEGDTVSQYDIGADGSLSPKSPPAVPAGDLPYDLAISPDGKSVYVASEFSDTVSQFDVGPGGTLSPKSPATVAADGARSVAVTPDGTSVYVVAGNNDVFSGSHTVFQFDVGPGGTLSPKSPPNVDAGDRPNDLAVSPDGESVYVVNIGVFNLSGNTASVSQYDVGPGGRLSPKSPATVAAGPQLIEVAVSPDGESVYVINSYSRPEGSYVFQFDVGPSGALVPKSPPRVAAGTYTGGVAVSADGKSVYVANGGNPPQAGSVSQYDVGTGGELSVKSPATVASGPSPARIAVSPLADEPTTKQQCKRGGWKQFDFKNQGQCIRFVRRKARQACHAERDSIGRRAFREKYGRGKHHRHPMRRCIRRAIGVS